MAGEEQYLNESISTSLSYTYIYNIYIQYMFRYSFAERLRS